MSSTGATTRVHLAARHMRAMCTISPSHASVRSEDYIESTYQYESTDVQMRNGKAVRRCPAEHAVGRLHALSVAGLATQVAVPKKVEYQFRTQRKTPKLGLMLVGWGGNNGRCGRG